MEQRRLPIGALQAGCNTALIVAVVINKSDPRKIIKKDSSERWVTTFTLRDSPLDIINFVIWTGGENAEELKK